jgi:hypothetical protein
LQEIATTIEPRIGEWPTTFRTKQKRMVIDHYSGGTNACMCCGETEPKFLALDHINNDGSEERGRLGSWLGSAFYYWLIKRGYPTGYQVMCHNCNFSKAKHGSVFTDSTTLLPCWRSGDSLPRRGLRWGSFRHLIRMSVRDAINNTDREAGIKKYCQSCQKTKAKEWTKNAIAKRPEYYREKSRQDARRYRTSVKSRVMGHYSNQTFVCACCGESEHDSSLSIMPKERATT